MDDHDRDTMPPPPPSSSPNHAVEFGQIVKVLLDDAMGKLLGGFELLRAEFRSMRTAHEARLADLEHRVSELERMSTAPPDPAE